MENYLGPSTIKRLVEVEDNNQQDDGWRYPGVDVDSLDSKIVHYNQYRGYRDTEMAYHLGPGFKSGPVYDRIERPAQEGDVTKVDNVIYVFEAGNWKPISQFKNGKWQKIC